MKAKFASKILVLSVLLALMFSAVGPAQAAGIYTHSVFVERAIERLTANGGYSELVNILNTYPAVVNYGATFPDTTLGSFNILGVPIPAPDDEWGENFLLADVPAGPYKVEVAVNGKVYFQDIVVTPGKTAWIEVRTQ